MSKLFSANRYKYMNDPHIDLSFCVEHNVPLVLTGGFSMDVIRHTFWKAAAAECHKVDIPVSFNATAIMLSGGEPYSIWL